VGGYLVKRVRSGAERDDLYQKIWLKFHRSREKWSSDYSLLQWLFVIARSVILDGLRSKKRSPDGNLVEDSEKELAAIASEDSSDRDSTQNEYELEEGFSQAGLSKEQCEVVRRRVFDEEEYEEIAEKIGKNATSVRKIFSRAIEKLRTKRLEGKR
jgi:RNA polymerase sigma factor (sigma-70 family)